MINNITFLNPPFHKRFSREQRSPGVTKSGTCYYPMWLCYAAGWLQKKGYKVLVIDAAVNNDPLADIEKKITRFGTDFLCITTSTPSIENDLNIAKHFKDNFPNMTIALAGPHVSALPQQILTKYPWIDYVLKGEYENIVAELIESLNSGNTRHEIKGLCYRDGDRISVNSEYNFVSNLDDIPFVSSIYQQFLNISDYFYSHSMHPLVTITTSRGCPYRCIYCAYPQVFVGHKLRKRTPQNIAEEFLYIQKNLPQVREVMLEDDTFTLDKKHIKEICTLLMKAGNRLKFTCNARADVDLETLKILKRAGCRMFCIGVESANEQILQNIEKNIKKENIYQFFKDTKKVGIMTHACFLVGNPGETQQTLEQTFRFALELAPDTAQFFPLMVYPGTKAWTWAQTKGYLTTQNFSQWVTKSGLHNSVVSTESLSAEDLVAFCNSARDRFYFRFSYFAKKILQVIKQPREFKRNFLGFVTLMQHSFYGKIDKEHEVRSN